MLNVSRRSVQAAAKVFHDADDEWSTSLSACHAGEGERGSPGWVGAQPGCLLCQPAKSAFPNFKRESPVSRFTPPLPACLYTDSSNQEQIRAERDWRTPVAFHQRRLKRVVPCIGCR